VLHPVSGPGCRSAADGQAAAGQVGQGP